MAFYSFPNKYEIEIILHIQINATVFKSLENKR